MSAEIQERAISRSPQRFWKPPLFVSSAVIDRRYNEVRDRRGHHDARSLNQDRQRNRNRSQIKRRRLWISNPTQKKIQTDNSEAKRWHIGHERAPGKDVQRRKSVKECRPNRRYAAEGLAHEQKEKWNRNSEENHGLAAPDPFVN